MCNLLNRKALIVGSLFFFVICGSASRSHAQTVLLVCTWDTSSIFKDKADKEKFERRFYISPMVSMTKEAFQKIDSSAHRIEGLCGDYLDSTVVKAATERGERLDPGGQLKVIRNIELSGEDVGRPNMYKFGTKEDIQKKLDEAVKEMEDANRFIMKFNWDTTGKAEAGDLANEQKRTLPSMKQAAKP
jgi:hypothetical protein